MNGTIVPILLLLLLVPAPPAAGQAAGAFSRMGFGARGVAMGNALVADGSGAASPYYNPALVPFTPQQQFEASVALLTFDRELQFLQFATPLKPRAGFAAGLLHAGVSGIDGRDANGYHTSDLATDEFAAFMAFGLRFSERVTGGVNLQLFRSDLLDGVDAVNTVGVDAGWTVQASQTLRLGLAIDDLLARYSWDTSEAFGDGGKTTEDRFPTRLRFGAAYRAVHGRLHLTGEYEARFATAEHRTRQVERFGDTPIEVTRTEDLRLRDGVLRLGGEYHVAEALALRGGFDRVAEGAFGAVQPTFGFMVAQPVGTLKVHAEYAFALEPYALGTLHLLTLRLDL